MEKNKKKLILFCLVFKNINVHDLIIAGSLFVS